MRQPTRSHTFIALVLCVSVLLLSSCQQGSTGSVIRIGMTAPLTGAAAESGIALKQGAELAIEEIHAAGGVDVGGQKFSVELFVEDNESKPEVGVSAAEKLITKERVHYLIGDAILSSVTMAIMELAPKYNIPIVSGESVSDAIADKVRSDPDKYYYYWKMNFGSTSYADTVFNTTKWLIDSGEFLPQTEKVFFIVEDTDYGRSNAQAASKSFQQIGWSTVAIEAVPMGHTEFYPQLNKLRESGADVLISVFTPLSSGVALVKQFRELEIEALHMAIYYPIRPEFIPQVGEAAEGLLWTPLLFDPEHIEAHQTFAKKIQEKFNVEPTFDHAFAYDAIYNAVDSISRAGSLEPKDIIQAVATLDREGIVGRFVFDQTSHQVKAGPDFIPIPVAQIQGGRNLIISPDPLASSQYQPQPWVK